MPRPDHQHEPWTRTAWELFTGDKLSDDGHAFTAFARATAGEPEGIRDFLDRRHFADGVCEFTRKGQSLEDAIRKTVWSWNGWKISRSIQREMGIPRGLPYLTGWIHHFGMLAEAA